MSPNRSTVIGLSLWFFSSCAHAPVPEDSNQKQSDLLVLENRKIAYVLGLDSILCAHVSGAQGNVYFDDPLWKNLRRETRKQLVECLDLRRNLQVKELSVKQPGEKAWTARMSPDERYLLIGTVLEDCLECPLRDVKAQYRLTRKDSTYFPARLGEDEIWK
ncbi:MAG TPA: hypothetical protein VLM37_05005 [Fibrobacteraceae bacterium]|nr:hypothetical protein [Fibrobacteraceae bacterium]